MKKQRMWGDEEFYEDFDLDDFFEDMDDGKVDSKNKRLLVAG